MSRHKRYNPSRRTIRDNPINPYTYIMPKYNPLKNNILEDTKNLCSFKGSSANIEELTITVGSYADLSVYLEANPIDEEE